MTLKQIIDELNDIAMRQPNLNSVVESGNIYDLNEDRNAKFSVFCAVQGQHQYNLETGENTYNFILYYTDRLKSDESNKIQVQSTALEVLKNILRTFKASNDIDVSNVVFDVFTESFAQLCAGAYATVSFIDYDDNCLDSF